MTPTKMFAGGIYIGGTHPASNGGAYLSMLKGFAGMKVVDGKIEFHPHLPKEIEELTFKYCQQDKIFKVHIKGDNVVLKEEI